MKKCEILNCNSEALGYKVCKVTEKKPHELSTINNREICVCAECAVILKDNPFDHIYFEGDNTYKFENFSRLKPTPSWRVAETEDETKEDEAKEEEKQRQALPKPGDLMQHKLKSEVKLLVLEAGTIRVEVQFWDKHNGGFENETYLLIALEKWEE